METKNTQARACAKLLICARENRFLSVSWAIYVQPRDAAHTTRRHIITREQLEQPARLENEKHAHQARV